MKYNKEFKRLLETDEFICKIPNTSTVVLSYDKWKKRIKCASVHFVLNWRLFLTKECIAIDQAIFSKHQPCSSTWFGCMRQRSVLSNEQKVRLCEMNKRTLYKICKKIDKQALKSSAFVARLWYTNMMSNHVFKFLDSKELVEMKLKLGQITADCPICFEPIQATSSIVTRCGHIICGDCCSHMWGASVSLAEASKKGMHCPLCRSLV